MADSDSQAVAKLRLVLDDELSHLPRKYQEPLVLCYLEGKTHEEAAGQLGWPVGTVKGRLARAREMLGKRLTRRGLAGSLAGLEVLAAEDMSAAVPAALLEATLRIGLAVAAGEPLAGAVPGPVAALLHEISRPAWAARLLSTALSLLAVGVLVGGSWLILGPQPAAPLAADAPLRPGEEDGPLPAGALARLGTARLRHQGPVRTVAYAPNGKLLASAGGDPFATDYSIRLWDAASGREIRRLNGHEGHILAIAISPDGTLLASTGMDRTVRLWDVATGQPLRQVGTRRFPASGVAFAPDGQSLAVAGEEGRSIRLYEVASGKQLQELSGPELGSRLAFTPDGKRLASGRSAVVLWDLAAGKEVARFRPAGQNESQEHVTAVALTPDGKTLASVGVNAEMASGSVRVWDVASGKELQCFAHRNDSFPTLAYLSAAFSADGKLLAAGCGDTTIRLWDWGSGREVHRLTGHTGYALGLAFAPDGKTLASGGGDETVRLWDVAAGRERRPFAGPQRHLRSVAFAPDGTALAGGSADGTVCLWDPSTFQLLRQFPVCRDGVLRLAFTPDGQQLAAASEDERLERPGNAIGLWQTTGQRVRRFQDENIPADALVAAVAVSSDGKQLATAGMYGVVVWDAATGKLLQFLGPVNDSRAHAVAFAPDGKALVSGHADGMIHFWDPGTGRALQQIAAHNEAVKALAFSPDGKHLASGSWDRADGVIRIWEATTGKLARKLEGHSNGIRSLAFAPDGKLLASGGDDRTLRLWDAAAGQELARRRSSEPVYSVSFAPDGKRLAWGSDTAILWDVAALLAPKRLP